MDRPRISVALCTYQAERYLGEQLESIARQTRPPDELVICDDNSNDETLRILEEFNPPEIGSVVVYPSASNLGTTKNFERAVANCTGDFVFFCDADDVWYPQKLELQEAALAALETPGIVLCDADIVDENLQPQNQTLWNSDVVVFTQEHRRRFLDGDAVGVIMELTITFGSTMGFSGKFKDLVLPIPPGCGPDTWTGILIGALADSALVEAPLMGYRQHPRQHVGARSQSPLQRITATESRLYPALIESYRIAQERLLALGKPTDRTARAISHLKDKAEHLQTRLEVIAGRRPLVTAISELRRGRYGRYSSGWKSAAKDLVLSARKP